jgi:hypothetical protein
MALVQNVGIPGNNSFVTNDLDAFQSSLSDIFVDAGVTNTAIVGRQGLMEDHGSGTVIVPCAESKLTFDWLGPNLGGDSVL